MKVNELIQRVQSLYSKGVHSDDTRLSPIHIYNKMITARSRLLSQEAKKKQKLNRWNYQTMPCIELIRVPKSQCPCLPPVGCQISRTKFKIPKPLTDYNRHLISSVSTVDGDIMYSETAWETLKYESSNKYTGGDPVWFELSEYVYVVQKLGPKVIAITGLFEDPLEVVSFPSYCAEKDCVDCDPCTDFNEVDFPIDADLVDILVEMAVNELISIFPTMIEDTSNNSSDSPQQQSK